MRHWIEFGIWALGFVLATPRAMRWWMSVPVCSHCGTWPGVHEHGKGKAARSYPRITRGAFRERTRHDAYWALVIAALWMWILAALIMRKLLTLGAHGVADAVIRGTPLTYAELQRRERERTAELERLHQQIAEDTRAQTGVIDAELVTDDVTFWHHGWNGTHDPRRDGWCACHDGDAIKGGRR